jgi:N-acetylneuraminic acid mutarotase
MKKLFTLVLILIISGSLAYSQGFWTQKMSVGAYSKCDGIGLATTTHGYVVAGYLGGYDHFKDTWEYDPTMNSWTQKSDFPGLKRRGLSGFVINDKCYVGLGAFLLGASNYTYYIDFYEFNPSTNTWIAKANFPGTPRNAAFSFSVNGKGYVGGGMSASGELADLWEYDPIANTWTQKNTIGCGARRACASFTIGNKAYIGTGYANLTYLKDFWEYNPLTDTWTQKSTFPGVVRWFASGFSLYQYGYIGAGFVGSDYYNDFWQYDPSTNSWTSIADLTGSSRFEAASFAINNKGYIATGATSDITYTNDVWEYTPSWYEVSENSNNLFSVFPNPANENLNISFSNPKSETSEIIIYGINGKQILQKQVMANQKEISVSCFTLTRGEYFISFKTKDKTVTKTFVKL